MFESRSHCLQALFLHDVPQLAQVGLGNGIVRFELQGSQVIGFSLLKFAIQMKDSTKVHQGCRVLKGKEKRNITRNSQIMASTCLERTSKGKLHNDLFSLVVIIPLASHWAY